MVTPNVKLGNVNWETIDQLLGNDKVLEAVKDYRMQTGGGLKEAMHTIASHLQGQGKQIPKVLKKYAQWPVLTKEQARKIAQEVFGRHVVNIKPADIGFEVSLQSHKSMGHMLPYRAQIKRVEENIVVQIVIPSR